jgi:phospho-N-acetylmuramoyl-pentapeptide-transferase
MLEKLASIMLYALTWFFLALTLYPGYIALLKKLKFGKQIRDDAMMGDKATIFAALHGHKTGTPTMWWGIFLLIMLLLIALSFVIQHAWITQNSLVNRQETYILVFAFFSMGILWLIDDWLNIIWKQWIKGMTAKMKILWMWLFSAFISYWFYAKLWVTALNIRPLGGEIELWIFMPVLTFFFTITIVNAINITDGLDWLASGLLLIVFGVIAVMTFVSQWFIATTLIAVVLWWLLAFLWFNINPAKIFMWDSWALALWWLLSALVYLLNIRFGVFIPFLVLMTIFWTEIGSSFFSNSFKKTKKEKIIYCCSSASSSRTSWVFWSDYSDEVSSYSMSFMSNCAHYVIISSINIHYRFCYLVFWYGSLDYFVC